MNEKKIFFWCPFVDKVATVKSVLNSAKSLTNFSNGHYKCSIIDVAGEWDSYSEDINKNKMEIITLPRSFSILKKHRVGFVISRLVYFYIFFSSFISLIKLIKNKKPDYLVIHLITFVPLVLFTLFNFETKLILRISGFPKLTIFRKLLWKFSSNSINFVTCPTLGTYQKMIINRIFPKDKINILKDPVISCKEFIQKKKLPQNIEDRIVKNSYILTVGRLTRQKNHIFLIQNFKSLLKYNSNLQLVIVGEGEKKEEIIKLIKELALQDKIFLIDYTNNISKYFMNCLCFVLPSLWEDPGFVIIESAFFNKTVISSNCDYGPEEFIQNDGGFLFNNNSSKDFLKKMNSFFTSNEKDLFEKKIILKKRSKHYSIFQHYQKFDRLLSK